MLEETSGFKQHRAKLWSSAGRKNVWRFYADLCHQTAVLFFTFMVDNKVLKEAKEKGSLKQQI